MLFEVKIKLTVSRMVKDKKGSQKVNNSEQGAKLM
jgi:hypothetical protein